MTFRVPVQRSAEIVTPEHLDLTTCPKCGAPAEVIDRVVMPSTDGPVEHVKVRCVTGEWFTVPAMRVTDHGHRSSPSMSRHGRLP